MNPEKLAQMQSQVRIGGKGSARRKKLKIPHSTQTDEKKLNAGLKKMSCNVIPGIDEVNMFKDDGTVIHFNNPKVQAALQSNTFAIQGQSEVKQLTEMLPHLFKQFSPENINEITKGQSGNVVAAAAAKAAEDDEVPELIENFDEASKNEAS